MDETEFDKFADEYNKELTEEIQVSGEKPEFFAEYKIRDTALLTSGLQSVDTRRILDFGAGIGQSVPYFKRYFPDCELTCVDVSRRSLEIGESRYHGQAQFTPFDGKSLPFPDNSFDVAFAACVFHHIEHDEHLALFRELGRVLAQGGRLVIFEHNPYNPLTRRVVNSCVFDENAVLIYASDMARLFREAGFESVKKCYRIFFPRIFRYLRGLEPYLGWIPLGAQYYVVGEKSKVT